jgi:hypothetical protein
VNFSTCSIQGIRQTILRRNAGGILSLGLVMAAAPLSASPLQIQITDQQFSTYTHSRLADYAYVPPNPDPAHCAIVSNRLSSSQTLSDSVYSSTWDYSQNNYSGPTRLEVKAEADQFRLETFAQSAGGDQSLGGAVAAAMSRITFNSLVNGSGTFTIDLLGWRQYYGAQFIRLTDLTLGQEIWSYGSDGMGYAPERLERLLPAGTTYQNELLWSPTGMGNECFAQVQLDTLLNTTSTYELTLFSTVESQPPETERIVMEWILPMNVPEPSALALVGVGGLGLLFRHRKQNHRV